ncbi:MAG: TIGR02266 family protein [Myxococcales bacterium]|nr:TIGR02266 family protein [Myxococcales bacterium]MBL8717020.1 TIGR02266 family protein [Myxococcales bacterium]
MSERDSFLPPSPSSPPGAATRRAEERTEVSWAVDCEHADTFLYAAITNVSSLGLFVRTVTPLPIGTQVRLSFSPRNDAPFRLLAEVAWINHDKPGCPNPGMGMRFIDLHLDERERLVEAIRTIAYLRS